MSERKLSAVEVLQPVARSLRRIEGELSTIAQVIEKMVQRIEENRLRPGGAAWSPSTPSGHPPSGSR